MCVACAFALPAADLRPPGYGPFPDVPSPFPWPDERPSVARLTWTGAAGFVFEAEGARIALDPFASRPGILATVFRRWRADGRAVAAAFPRLDAVFFGHTHYDHAMDMGVVAEGSRRATIHGGRVALETARRLGIAADRLRPVEDGRAAEVGPFRVTPVRAEHGVVPFVGFLDRIELPAEGLPQTPFRWPRGEVLAYRVEVGGRSFHVQGSAGIDDAALARQAPCDVLIACLAAREGTPRYLERLGERLRPRVLVPCHHDDFFRPLSEPPRPVATLRWPAFRREAARLAAAHGTRLWLPVRGVPATV